MYELITGLQLLHLYTENVYIEDEYICVDVEGLVLTVEHERYLASYDWKLLDNAYKFEMEVKYTDW